MLYDVEETLNDSAGNSCCHFADSVASEYAIHDLPVRHISGHGSKLLQHILVQGIHMSMYQMHCISKRSAQSGHNALRRPSVV